MPILGIPDFLALDGNILMQFTVSILVFKSADGMGFGVALDGQNSYLIQ
jgi:hypothetical protein